MYDESSDESWPILEKIDDPWILYGAYHNADFVGLQEVYVKCNHYINAITANDEILNRRIHTGDKPFENYLPVLPLVITNINKYNLVHKYDYTVWLYMSHTNIFSNDKNLFFHSVLSSYKSERQ